MSAITVSHVNKEFQLGQVSSLRKTLSRGIARLRGRPPGTLQRFKALEDISFTVERGEVLGIIGTNGAGKSTLLKLLARITVPSSGRVSVRGKIAPLIEVGAGLISDLTGRENIYLNGVILGMPYAEIKKKFDEIVAFAELEEFIDTPIKRYSSGMAVRLGFSIATYVDADILIVDEVLAVGDLAFQRKCFDRMEDMIKRQGKTVLLVSHNTRQIERLCTRVMLIDKGHMVADGDPRKVCDLFYERSDRKIDAVSHSNNSSQWSNTLLTNDLELTGLEILDEQGKASNIVIYRTNVSVRIRFIARKELVNPMFLLGIHTTDFLYLTRHHSERQVDVPRLSAGSYEINCQIRDFPLLPGIYALFLDIGEAHGTSGLFYAENLLHFQVVNSPSIVLSPGSRDGFLALDANWNIPRLTAPSLHS